MPPTNWGKHARYGAVIATLMLGILRLPGWLVVACVGLIAVFWELWQLSGGRQWDAIDSCGDVAMAVAAAMIVVALRGMLMPGRDR